MIWVLFILQVIILFGGFIFIFILGYGILFGAPYIGTRHNVARAMIEFSEAGEGHTVLDLGSGLGSILLTAKQEFSVDRVIGYEINPLLAFCSRLRLGLHGIHRDQFQIYCRSISTMRKHFEVSTVFVYLLPGLMDKIIPVLCDQLSPEVKIVSNGFEFSGVIPLKELRIHNATLRLYSMNDVMAYEYERGNNS
jgi:ribosomal protein L11 methylase PrmA